MKTQLFFTLLIFLFSSQIQSQTLCENGMAGSYPCNDYDLMSHIPLSTMSASAGNDSWGWTDPTNNNEYAIIALNNGTAFIDISDPINPIYLGKLPTATSNSSWRDVKVYQNHAFIVSEAPNHGMQVFDLTRLRNVANPPQTFTVDKHFTDFGSAHNIVINEDSGYAYAVGTSRAGTYRGGPVFINIQDPVNPVSDGGFLSTGDRAYSHDAQVVNYNGPDSDYAGREILIGSNEIEVVIADITNKSNPTTISTIKYSDVGYTHQGWFTEDMRYFILGDETDEQGVGFNTRTIVFDLQDLDNPVQHMVYTGPTPAIDHNGYVKGDKFYLANYRAGIRVIDISDIGNKNMTEIGSFDTFPSSNSASFNGVWNVYPYFNSGNIVISDIEGGFFLVRQSNTLSVGDFSTKEKFSMYPNPASSRLTINGGDGFQLEKIEIYNILGKKVDEITSFDTPNSTNLALNYSSGIYLVRVNDNLTKKLIINK
ncbi:choice-of-anchor B family protein [Aquimarina sp. 2201CG5-10]|uniref:choice-of-anchor B family protein n=1 Tax=Aquimarina callyspongiae TaxID=3098150 RepID=UPI002AB3914C|nr:choice-of-anchor B family protein [Aquimarina sp. 2201CG5-10]MDY8135084.1 choice-of-anchor B family protein [Aquimarina sp. 2201CG5-10]